MPDADAPGKIERHLQLPAAGKAKEKKMGALRIIAAIIMAIFTLNIVRKLIAGEIKAAAWRKGAITDQVGAELRLRNARSLRFSFGFLILAMAAFFFSE